ncbi:MAG: alpha-ketoacid dehydrogenase subunit beta [Zhaonellaceae bacterium]|jgi:pyruvate/2-oxoglutarate/acetoin dehydrogenase E1 component|nr:alpha-ketoacid dehydrogenase subunit beta [Clostridia bacterium]
MSRIISYGKAINEALHQEMERDENVFILGEDVAKMGGDFGITQGIWHKWPHRAKDTPLSEQAIVGLACGAAVRGLRPVAEIMFADFISCSFDQMVNNAAKLHFMFNGKVSCPIVVRAPQGAGIRCAYHHSQSVESWFMNVPGLVIVAPSTPYDAKGLLISSIRNDNPILFLEHKMLYNMKGEVPEESYEIPLFKADVKRQGSDITIVAYSRMLHFALEAAERLAQEGVSVEVVDPRTLYPIEKETIINSVGKTGRLVIVQEAPKTMGYASEISAIVTEEIFEYLKAPIKRVASLDAPVAFSPVLEDYVLPTVEDVVKAAKEVMEY